MKNIKSLTIREKKQNYNVATGVRDTNEMIGTQRHYSLV